jgi:hypothetical protein
MFKTAQFAMVSILTVFLLAGCHPSVPEGAPETITLMANYNKAGHYDDAIKLAQDWLKAHPHDVSHTSTIYQQIALTYLSKAAKDTAHKDEWIQQSVANFDRDLSVHQNTDADIELYIVGRGFETAGHYSTTDGCPYYRRAVKAFEDEAPFIQGESVTLSGTTVKLAPIRQENDKALQRAKAEFAEAGCK